jgi:hypothetical protein
MIFFQLWYQVTVPQHFSWFGEIAKGNNSKRFRHIIWLAITWSIWRTRNNILFIGECVNFSSLVNQIIYICWLWFIGRLRSNTNLSFFYWCNNVGVWYSYM